MVHFYSVYIPEPAEKYIHILKGCLEKNVSSYFIFCKDLYVELCCNSFKCDGSATSSRRSEMCVVTVGGEFPCVPTVSKWNGDSRQRGNAALTFSSPYLEWHGWTHASFQRLARMVCLCDCSHCGSSFHKHFSCSIFCFASVNKRRPSPSPRGHKWAVPAVGPAFPLSCLAELSCLSSWWIFTSSLRFFSQPLLFLSFCLILLFHHLALDKSFISYNLPLFCEME